ncbi:endonuclease III [Desulfovibrio litoralis]|uniref:Endonuclease III n=1 Tax=Desulfovibrio litoralis DSM 11393 TaxID=1121455 RepID=A0A1M7STJ3_9BACT|nr:endonuclease III [Desulfovibrio litoralis]SHN61716.1 DNA-(apurinic or apyrimidinic site) lyase /endonuclease III [Desulfovibrio litoralis DSM 11393]
MAVISLKNKKQKASLVLAELKALYPEIVRHLKANNPWELLIATILSAQCTDARVNQVTPFLFERWKTPSKMGKADLTELEKSIYSLGFYLNKAKNIQECSRLLESNFNSQVPKTLEELITLPGVGRKTASVVLWNAYGINAGIAIDTHVARISWRLGLTSSQEPIKAERELMLILPQKEWGVYNHRMVSFGRDVCTARSPKCLKCSMQNFCVKNGVV